MGQTVVEVIEFTDPICTWCWGCEPLIRKLETRYGDSIRVKFIMGGLVKDIRDFYDSFNDIGGDPKHSNQQIAKHWVEASKRHGMPVNDKDFMLFSNEYPSSYPQNIAYKAAQMESEHLADKFLRKIREATATQGKQTTKTEVLIELANESGLDVSKFIERFNDGSAMKAFEEDMAICRKYSVRGFPTFLIRYGEKEILLRGYQRFETVKSVIKTLTEDAIKEREVGKTEDDIYGFIKKYNSAALVEIKEAFDLSDSEVTSIIENLISKGSVRKVPAGNSYFVEVTSDPMACDDDSGICEI